MVPVPAHALVSQTTRLSAMVTSVAAPNAKRVRRITIESSLPLFFLLTECEQAIRGEHQSC
jgi:hypothetical protein